MTRRVQPVPRTTGGMRSLCVALGIPGKGQASSAVADKAESRAVDGELREVR